MVPVAEFGVKHVSVFTYVDFAYLYLIFPRFAFNVHIWSNTCHIQHLVFGVFDLFEHTHFRNLNIEKCLPIVPNLSNVFTI